MFFMLIFLLQSFCFYSLAMEKTGLQAKVVELEWGRFFFDIVRSDSYNRHIVSGHYPKIIDLIRTNAPLKKIEEILNEEPNSLNKIYHHAETPLFIAIQKGDEQLVNFLVRAGAQVNLAVYNMSPLKKAIGRGDYSMVILLLKLGADVNLAEKFMDRPLNRAIDLYKNCQQKKKSNLEALSIIKILREKGAKFNWEIYCESRKKDMKESWKEVKGLLKIAQKQIIVYKSPEAILFGKK